MTESEKHENLIAKYLNGPISDAEKGRLFSWVNASPDNKRTFIEIKDAWDASGKTQVGTNEKLLQFYKQQAHSRKRIPLWQTVGAIAAVLLIGLFFGILIPNHPESFPVANTVFSVPLGSKSHVLLPDGTTVMLNSGSSITYPSSFSQNMRNVSLSGEAFFEVHSDPENPFTVSTPDFKINVTGTRFNVSAYPDDKTVSATLAEGVIDIALKGQGTATKLKPGEKITVDRTENKAQITNADVEMETAWKSGEFIFKEIAFADLVVKLERWYDVKINYSDKRFDTYNYTGRFKNQETIWQVLDALQLTSPIDYERKDFREFNLKYKPR